MQRMTMNNTLKFALLSLALITTTLSSNAAYSSDGVAAAYLDEAVDPPEERTYSTTIFWIVNQMRSSFATPVAKSKGNDRASIKRGYEQDQGTISDIEEDPPEERTYSTAIFWIVKQIERALQTGLVTSMARQNRSEKHEFNVNSQEYAPLPGEVWAMMNAMLSTNPSAGPSSSASLAQQLSPAEIVAVLSQTQGLCTDPSATQKVMQDR